MATWEPPSDHEGKSKNPITQRKDKVIGPSAAAGDREIPVAGLAQTNNDNKRSSDNNNPNPDHENHHDNKNGKNDDNPVSSPSSSRRHDASESSLESDSLKRRILRFIYWVPPWCRWDQANPPRFTIWHNILFAFAGACTVANLYYNHPILNILADEFHASQATVSRVPTLMQAGYASGLWLLLPLGDMVPRRRLVLTCILFTATMWIGLCTTSNFTSFIGISFITGMTTVTPQIMLPLVAELAPPERRAVSLSIVGSGNALGIVIARIMSGVVTNFTSWRNIYWLALGLQYLILTLLFLFMPDYPSTNPLTAAQVVTSYPRALWSIPTLLWRNAVLVQSGLISFCTSVPFTTYWTTLTFLLAGAPYRYNSVEIGLFGLIGLATISMNPVYGKYLVARLREPLFSIIVAQCVNLCGVIVGTYTGERTVAGPIIQGFTLDATLQIVSIANRIAIHNVAPTGRNRVNTAFMLMTFLGQLTGTSAGNALYDRYGGWVASGSLSVAMLVACLGFVAVRGPYETRWIGWRGGWRMRPSWWKAEQDEDEDDVEEAGTGITCTGPGPVEDVEKGALQLLHVGPDNTDGADYTRAPDTTVSAVVNEEKGRH